MHRDKPLVTESSEAEKIVFPVHTGINHIRLEVVNFLRIGWILSIIYTTQI